MPDYRGVGLVRFHCMTKLVPVYQYAHVDTCISIFACWYKHVSTCTAHMWVLVHVY